MVWIEKNKKKKQIQIKARACQSSKGTLYENLKLEQPISLIRMWNFFIMPISKNLSKLKLRENWYFFKHRFLSFPIEKVYIYDTLETQRARDRRKEQNMSRWVVSPQCSEFLTLYQSVLSIESKENQPWYNRAKKAKKNNIISTCRIEPRIE